MPPRSETRGVLRRTVTYKGKVERNVAYVQDNALKGRSFGSLAEQNRYLLEWETRTVDQRIHGTTRKQVKKCFENEERQVLLSLPTVRFPADSNSRQKAQQKQRILRQAAQNPAHRLH